MKQRPDDDPRRQLVLVTEAARRLGEHFDSVLILCTGPTNDGTGSTTLFKSQNGNVHAHEGAVREWLREVESYQNAYFAKAGWSDASGQK